MKLLNLNGIALEAIEFQSPEMADKMTEYLEDILKCKGGMEADKSDAKKNIIKLIKDKTGLNVELKFNSQYPPCMYPIFINPNSVLGYDVFADYYAKDANKVIKHLEDSESTFVDLRSGKVGGLYTKVPTQIFMGFRHLRDMRLTARETAAVLMHEIGHAFVAYELAFNTIQTNQILLALHKSLLANDQTKFEYSLKLAEKRLGETTGVYNELKNETDSKVITTVILAKNQEKRKSELGTAAYDRTTFEALADNYATRMGLGRELVTALEKITRLYGGVEYSLSTRFIINIIQIYCASYMMIAGLAFGSGFVILAGLGLFMLMSWSLSSGNEFNNIYDDLKIRYKRIREQLVGRLKNKYLDPVVVKETLASLNQIDKIIDEVGSSSTFLTVVGNIMFPSNWVLSSRKNAQRLLEELAVNDLYIKAAQLRNN